MNCKKFVSALMALVLCMSTTALAVRAQTEEYPKISPKLQEVMQSGETLIEVGVWYQPIDLSEARAVCAWEANEYKETLDYTQYTSREIEKMWVDYYLKRQREECAKLHTEKAARIAQEIGLESDTYWSSKYVPMFTAMMTVEQIEAAAAHAEVQELSNGMETTGEVIENATECPTEDGFAGGLEPTETGLENGGNHCDVNGDGVTNAADAAYVLVLSAEVGSGSFAGSGELDFSRADFNDDGVINANDAADVLVYAASEGAGNTDSEEPISEIDISVRSLKELESMRSSLSLSDEELNSYLAALPNGASLTREDVTNFVDLVCSLPVPEIENFEITWINHSIGMSEDSGEPYDIAFITMESANGEWVRFEYVLSVKDVKAEIDSVVSDPAFEGTSFENPIENADGSVKVYAESREKHVSGNGDLIIRHLDCSGMFVRVYYKTNEEASLDLQDLIDNQSPLGSLLTKQ